MSKIKEWSDEKCLAKAIELIEDRVTISTAFVANDEGVLTHQVLVLTSGEYSTESGPAPLEVPLIPANAEQLKKTVQ